MILHQKYTVSILEKRCLGSVYFINYTCQVLRSLSSTLSEYLIFFPRFLSYGRRYSICPSYEHHLLSIDRQFTACWYLLHLNYRVSVVYDVMSSGVHLWICTCSLSFACSTHVHYIMRPLGALMSGRSHPNDMTITARKSRCCHLHISDYQSGQSWSAPPSSNEGMFVRLLLDLALPPALDKYSSSLKPLRIHHLCPISD